MDTTAKYILMAEKGKEIQNRKPEVGDFYAWTNPAEEKWKPSWLDSKMIIGLLFGDRKYSETIGIWLPGQDNLQEMSGLSWWEFDQRCNEIRRCLLEDPLSEIEIETKEQAGMCVVMEKYNKGWNGKDWVHEKN